MHLSGISYFEETNRPHKIKKLKYYKDSKLTEYKMNYGLFLLKGSPFKPSHWFECGYPHDKYAHCETYFNYNNQISLNIFFKRDPILKDHIELRRRIVEKINSFRVDSGGSK